MDPGKDQSYVLAVLTSDQLAHSMFPLGDTPKAQVRAEAARRGLAVADKPDSHDVCFIADGDTKGFLARHLGQAPGQIVDTSGAVVGEHQGAYGFTVGQRRGLRVGTPAGDGRPRYVLDIEPVTRTVTVGTAEDLDISEITATARSGRGARRRRNPDDCLIQLRAHGDVHACTAWLDGDALRIRLRRAARGRGQGPGRRPLRRRHRPRQRDHQRDVLTVVSGPCPPVPGFVCPPPLGEHRRGKWCQVGFRYLYRSSVGLSS